MSEHNDPLEQLRRFGDDLEGAPVPMTAAQIRRRGDHLRRRTNAVRSGVAALAVAAVVVPLALSAGHHGTTHPGPAKDPNQVVGGIGEVNVLTDEEAVYSDSAPDYHWQRVTSAAGEPTDGVNPCARGDVARLGAISAYHRSWQLADASGPLSGPATVDTLTETALAFPSAAEASAAVSQYAAWVADCAEPLAPGQHYHANRPQVIDTGDPDDISMLIESNYLQKPYGDADGRFIETGLVARGSRVAVLTLLVGGPDFNVSPPPVEAMLPTAAHRLDLEQPATVPTGAAAPGVAPLDEGLLVRPADVGFMDGVSWSQTYSGAGETQAPFSVCAAQPLEDIGASATVQRDFTAGSDETGEPADAYLDESIGEFGSPDAAATAAATIRGWYDTCRPTGATATTVVQPWRGVDTGTPATAQTSVRKYGPASALPGSQFDTSGRTGLSWYVDVSVVVDGSRVAVLTQNALLVDYDDTAVTTAAENTPTAARRLTGGPTATTGSGAGSGAGSGSGGGSNAAGVPTTIPDDFPLDDGWQDDTPEGADSVLPPSRTREVGEFDICGTKLPWPAYEDRMDAGFHNPEDNRDRTLFTYADADAAVAATKSIVDLFRGCPQERSEPPGYVAHYTVEQTRTSGDSWHISRYYTYNGADAISIDDLHVIRVGLAVLILHQNNEGSRTSIPQDFTAMNDEAANVIPALCRFTVDGC